ncbi:MAG: UDP-N-acetylmuramoyl-L-alanyl-D-glutamate--2,6-diaminopimelate ligase, partial [Candidatus Eremiobacteraeota bacterium]|nr:UDP-N-acetylmuramoyl-L-alanyl-D-glutamate--2,6-diaminopimelate ligase [Candidatus Eremiobacteraeota bacterium]
AALLDYKTPLKNTTPLADELHKTLADLRDRGARAVVLEVSSHALALGRVAGLRFAVAALTNVTRDHLDFHGTFESYANAKRTLFEACERAIFNVDDDCGAAWSRTFEPERAMTYSLRGGADFVAEDIALHAHGSRFFVDGTPFEIPLAGRFNVANALAAIAVGRALNIDFATIAMALRSISGVRGRMETLEGQSLQVFIDYAHTPDALSAALRSLRELKPKRLTVVFGCGGDRDRGKRSEMGAIAAQVADRIIVTSDNPRSEPPAAIAQAIVDGIGHGDHEVILDRRAAIERAIEGASSGEMVLIAGKGHETSQTVGDRVLAFDDRQVATDALRRRSERR